MNQLGQHMQITPKSQNKTKILRHSLGLSQQEFANHFGIPVATIKDWEQGRRSPPEYVLNMIEKIIEYEKKH